MSDWNFLCRSSLRSKHCLSDLLLISLNWQEKKENALGPAPCLSAPLLSLTSVNSRTFERLECVICVCDNEREKAKEGPSADSFHLERLLLILSQAACRACCPPSLPLPFASLHSLLSNYKGAASPCATF